MEQAQAQAAGTTKVVVFFLQEEEYGVEVSQVRSIERLQAITRVPGTPRFVKGVMNLRGVVTPVVELRSRFDLPAGHAGDNCRIIIISYQEMEVGLIVDEVSDVIDIPLASIEQPPKIIGDVDSAFVRGVAKLEERLLVMIDLDKVLSQEEMQQMAGMGE